MTMNRTDTFWHDHYRMNQYAPAAQHISDAIDEAAKGVMETLAAHGFKTCNLDGAESMVAAITRYLYESNGYAILDNAGDIADALQVAHNAA